MHHISVPVAFLYHDTSKPVSCKLIVLVPKYNFKKEFNFNVIPKDIFHQENLQAQDTIKFEIQSGRVPYVVNYEFHADDEYLTCVLFLPVCDVKFAGSYADKCMDNVPVRTMNLKQNGAEIGGEIPNLEPRFNFKSWVNPHLKSGHRLTHRIYVEVEHAISTRQKNKPVV
jgi:hypothetical protein